MTEGIGGAGVDDGSRVLERRGALGVVVGTWGLIILVVVELNACNGEAFLVADGV